VKRVLKIPYYVRYTDDLVIAHHSPDYLRATQKKVEGFLTEHLRLELHPRKISLRKYRQGIDFLGYVLLPHTTVLRTKTKRRIFKKLWKRIVDFKQEKVPEEKLLQTVNSYFGVLKHAKSYKLTQRILHFLWSSLKSPPQN